MIERLRSRFGEYWPHDDTPGFTDYPEVDIAAHRANAKIIRVIGLLGFVLGLIGAVRWGEPGYILGGFAWAGFSLWAADGLRLQALEWEIELLKEDNE